MTKIFMALILAYGLALSTALAEPDSHDNQKMFGKHLAKELNLTAEQIQQVKKIKENSKQAKSDHRKLLTEAKKDLKQSLRTPQRGAEYKSVLMEKFKKVQALKAEESQRRFEMALEIREILTDDQLKNFKGFRRGHHGPQSE